MEEEKTGGMSLTLYATTVSDPVTEELSRPGRTVYEALAVSGSCRAATNGFDHHHA
jgi:hypothetical protein